MRSALICGAGGLDGADLAQLLLARGYRVVGTSRDAQSGRQGNFATLGIETRVSVESMALNDFRGVLEVLHATLQDA